MDFDGIAREWANSNSPNSLSSPAILARLLDYDTQQLGMTRDRGAQLAELAHALQLIDVLASFQLAKQRLDDAKQAALRIAEIARHLVGQTSGVPDLALASVRRAVDAQEAAHLALDKAQTGKEKIHAAVVLELADAAASKALEASEAADKLTAALDSLVRATEPVGEEGDGQALARLERDGLQ
jgi:hypothetical protein